MSEQYSKTKGKKLRRRTSAPPETRTKAEIAVARLAKHGIVVDKKMEQEKYLRLLRRLINQKIDNNTFRKIESMSDEELTYGTIDSVFKASQPIKWLIKIGSTSLPDMALQTGEYIAQKVEGLVLLCDQKGQVFRYNPKKMVYTQIVSAVELPVDLRKWNTVWAKMFIRASLVDRATNKKCNIGSTKNLLLAGTTKLHSIRKINQYPGKRQRLAVEKTKEIYDMDAVVTPAAKGVLFSH